MKNGEQVEEEKEEEEEEEEEEEVPMHTRTYVVSQRTGNFAHLHRHTHTHALLVTRLSTNATIYYLWAARGPNQQHTLNKLPTELRCRIFFNKHRLSVQIVAKRAKACMQCKNVYASCTTVGGWGWLPPLRPMRIWGLFSAYQLVWSWRMSESVEIKQVLLSLIHEFHLFFFFFSLLCAKCSSRRPPKKKKK